MKPIRIGICVLVAFAVLAFGGVEVWGQGILEIGASALFLLWGLQAARRRRAEIHWNWIYLPLMGFGGFAWIQLVFGMSAYPYATKIELLKCGAGLMLFFLAVESYRTDEDRKQFAWFLTIFGFVVSLFGIVQSFLPNGKLYWIVPLRQGGGPFGPYVDRNHFAGFVELIAPLGLARLFFRAVSRQKVVLLALLTILPIGALVLSASRGGLISLAFQMALLAILARGRALGKAERWSVLFSAFAAVILIAWLGIGPVLERFEPPHSESLSQDGRAWIYRDTWQIFLHHPWTGAGLGTLQTVFPRYETHYQGGNVDHAHNDFLELLSDTGVVGGLCGLAFVALLLWNGYTNLRQAASPSRSAFHAGTLVACAGLLVHSLFDFNLRIPANALIFLLLAALSTSTPKELKRGRPEKRSVRVASGQGV